MSFDQNDYSPEAIQAREDKKRQELNAQLELQRQADQKKKMITLGVVAAIVIGGFVVIGKLAHGSIMGTHYNDTLTQFRKEADSSSSSMGLTLKMLDSDIIPDRPNWANGYLLRAAAGEIAFLHTHDKNALSQVSGNLDDAMRCRPDAAEGYFYKAALEFLNGDREGGKTDLDNCLQHIDNVSNKESADDWKKRAQAVKDKMNDDNATLAPGDLKPTGGMMM